ncbi:MAG: FkbM family methyltransferase [Candidatus Delongbacteria bacterium]|nr:FkbM family methyltransferase [Candidatus Delongbacteria bacterium]
METEKLKKFLINIENIEEYRTIKNEIFNKDCYFFKTDKKAPLIFDIGAHIGLATIYFKSVYPNSIIYAFEPNPDLFKLLTLNIEQNHLNNVYCINSAISNKTGTSEFFIDSSNKQWLSTGSFYNNHCRDDQENNKILVKTLNLDSQINKEVDLLKIDAEGAENKILLNFTKFSLIKNIILEYHSIDGKKPNKIMRLFRKKGFTNEIINIEEQKGAATLFLIKASNKHLQ